MLTLQVGQKRARLLNDDDDHVKKKIQHIVVSQIARDQKGLFLLRIYGLHSFSCSMFVTILYFLAYIVPHEWASRVDLDSKREKNTWSSEA